MRLSKFGENLCQGSGIGELMKDLGLALEANNGATYMLGGGQPASIAEINAIWHKRMTELLQQPEILENTLSKYDPPQGNTEFLTDLASLLKNHYNWNLTSKNIAITAGGQSAFFFLFNALAGAHVTGEHKKIILPLVPEYIGYANQSIGENLFRAIAPKIKVIGEHSYKYQIDFEQLKIDSNAAAICVSRPTNPSGNVLTDSEIEKLADIATENNIPLIIDSAYGNPFPNIFFSSASPYWTENVILTMSLSKLGLPGTRTGIVIANESVIDAISSINSIVGLSNGNIGQKITQPLIKSGEILNISNTIIQPYYLEKSLFTQQFIHQTFSSTFPYKIHLSEGALFLWLWFPELPISTLELYKLLKDEGVLIVPGEHFFFGLPEEYDDWEHRKQCIRLTYSMDKEVVKKGILILAKVLKKLHL